MKKLLLDIHIYVGLIFGPYFVIYGLSTMAFNHGWGPPRETVTQHTVDLPEGLDDYPLAQAVRDSLGLWGGVSEWLTRRDDDGRLTTRIERPGRREFLTVNTETGGVTVRREDAGLWGVIKSLHGLRGVPGSAWSNTWWVYSEVSIWALLFASLGGVYFWWDRTNERRIGWWMLGVGSAVSVFIMLYMAT